MVRIVLTLACVLGLSVSVYAQNKEIDEARLAIKNGKDLDKAEKLLTGLFAKDSVHVQNPKIYDAWYDVVMAQYAQANEKLYLKQKYDTSAVFNLVKHLYDIALSLDSIDARPNRKGKVRPEYRKEHAAQLNQLRPNVYGGGTYHIRKGDYATAYDFFSHYVKAAEYPLFTGYPYATADSLLPQAAYWATFCGFRLKDAERTLQFHQQALADHSKAQYTLQYMCEAYLQQHRQTAYLETLRQGCERFPEYPYFFPRLADYYTSVGQNDSVLVIAAHGLKANAGNKLFLLAKSIALLNLERYDECISTSKQLLAVNDKMPEPYFNIATCYLNQALVVEQENEPRKNREKLQQLYAEARPYMENYRKLLPDDSQRWAPGLYRIYLNLNMGRQFDEIDRLMRK